MIKTVKKFWATIALLSVELLIVFVLFFISLFSFIFIVNNVFGSNDTSFDTSVFLFLEPFINSTNTAIMRFITFFATHRFLLPANIFLASYFIFRKHRWYSIKIPVVALSSYLVMASLKVFFNRARPDNPVFEAAMGFSFPSGHAMSAVTFYGILIYIVWGHVENKIIRWILTILLLAFIFLIGFSRVYLRVHYASDVLAGFSMGLIWLVLSLWIMNKIEKFTRKEVAPAVNETGELL
jgi:membrane-associated phospholipid phosphatase